MASCLLDTKPLPETRIYYQLESKEKATMKFETAIQKFSFKKMHLKILSETWYQFVLPSMH